MERQNPGMVRSMDRLDERMEVLDKRIQDKVIEAGGDYLSFLESRAEEAHKGYYQYKCFRDLKKKARKSGSPEKVLEYLRERQSVCLGTLLRQDIATRSTSPMANMAYTLRLECVQLLAEDYGHLIRMFADPLRQQETLRDARTLREKENRRGPELQAPPAPGRPRV